jgi:hypothetical protein
MALTKVYLGRKVDASEQDYGSFGAGTMRLFVPNRQTKNLFLKRLGGWMGRETGTNVPGRFAVYATDGSRNPSSRLGYSGIVTLTVAMTGVGGGAKYEADVDQSDNLSSDKSILIYANTYPAIGFVGTNGDTGHSMLQENALPGGTTDARFFTQIGANSPPPGTYGGPAGAIEGHMSVWAECYENEVPRVPVNRSPSGVINDVNPAMEGDFRDRNGAWGPGNDGLDLGDKLSKVKINLRRASDNVTIWTKTYTAQTSEVNAGRSSYTYDGPALVRGTEYEWQIAHADVFNEYGDFSDWLSFTPAGGPLVTLDANPTGTLQQLNPTQIEFKYHHTSGNAGTHVRVRIENANSGALVFESAWIAKAMSSAALPGSSQSITWAALSAPNLVPGGRYRYKVRARDNLSQESSYQGTGRLFVINAAPSVPAAVSPNNGVTVMALPKLTVTATDADDTVGTGLTVTGKIYLAGVQQGGIKTFTLRSGTTNTWDYQVVSGDGLSVGNTYTWDAIAFDGTFYSGATGATTEGAGTRMAARSFAYSAGTVITPTSPASGSTIADGSPLVTWTGTFAKKRLSIYEAGTSNLIWASHTGLLWAVSSVGEYQVPDGVLKDGQEVDFLIEVESAGGTYGAATIVNVHINYDPVPAPAYFFAVPVPIGRDVAASGVDLEWGEYTGSLPFAWYLVYRDDVTKGPIAKLTSPELNHYRDANAVWGVDHEYRVCTVVWNNLQRRQSPDVFASARIEFSGILLHAKDAPVDERLILPAWRDRDFEIQGEETTYMVAGADAPITVRSHKAWQVGTIVAQLADMEGVSAYENRIAIEKMWARGGPLLYRDGYGRKMWVSIPRVGGVKVKDLRNGRHDVTIIVRGEHVDEALPT